MSLWPLSLLLVIVPLLTGCATLPTFRGPPQRLGNPAPAWPAGLNDYRGIIHCHSYLSHDSRGTPEEIQRACERVGVDFLIMTDHITPGSVEQGMQGMKGRTLFMVGAEFSKGNGSVLGLDLREYINAKLSTANVVAGIHQQRGLAFVGHAESFTDWDVAEFDGMEVYNTHANAKLANKAWLAIKALFVPPGTFFRSMIALNPPNLTRWDAITQRRQFPGIFGNDAHQNIHIFGPRAGTIGTYEQLFKITTTHVIAPRLDRESVMAALRAGHCYGALELWGDATGFSFTASDGKATLLMGDEAQLSGGWTLEVRLPVEAEIRLIHNGHRVLTETKQSLSLRPSEAGVYRVEVWLNGRPWIVSNPIYFRSNPA